MSHATPFAYCGLSRHLFLTIHLDTTGIMWDRGKNKWAVADTLAKYRTLSSCGVPMDMEADTKNHI